MKKANEIKYEVVVTRAKDFDTSVSFDMEVNGVTIYGCTYREGKSKADKDYAFISFPQKKDKNGKYWNEVYFKIDEELQNDIVAQIEKLI